MFDKPTHIFVDGNELTYVREFTVTDRVGEAPLVTVTFVAGIIDRVDPTNAIDHVHDETGAVVPIASIQVDHLPEVGDLPADGFPIDVGHGDST